jgi:hypothetical protein
LQYSIAEPEYYLITVLSNVLWLLSVVLCLLSLLNAKQTLVAVYESIDYRLMEFDLLVCSIQSEHVFATAMGLSHCSVILEVVSGCKYSE